MSDQPPTPLSVIPLAEHDVARRVLRWLAIGGIVVGCAELLMALMTLAAQGFGWSPFRRGMPLRLLYRIVATLAIAAPILLLVGAAALLRDRRWARPVLTVYAFLQIAASIVGLAYWFVWRASAVPEWTVIQHLLSAVSSLGNAVMHCLYPAAIIVCLVRPGLIQYAPPPGAAFQVLPPGAGATPIQS